VAQVVGLELGHADEAAVRLAEPPDVLAADLAEAPQAAPARPPRSEERDVGRQVLDLMGEHQEPSLVRRTPA
jgi:hypothetical protein